MNSPGIDFDWLRRIRVSFEGLQGGGSKSYDSDGTRASARIVARIEKVIQDLPDASTVMLYNLSADTRAAFVDGKTKIRVEAGWDQGPRAGLRQCYYGTLVTAFSQRSGQDIVTSVSSISMGEGLATATVIQSWGPGTPVKTIVRRMAEKLRDVRIDAARIMGLDGMSVGKGGWAHADTARRGLDRLSTEFGFSWTICDGVFQAVKDRRALGGGAVIESPYLIDVNPVLYGSGIGRAITGLRIRCTFAPTVNPQRAVSVRSTVEPRFNREEYLVQSVTHELDCFNKHSFVTQINAAKDRGA